MSLDSIVNVQITRSSNAVTRVGFGIPLILSAESPLTAWGAGEVIRYYTEIKGVAGDFATTTGVYKAAAAAFSQLQTPSKVGVASRSAKIGQVVTVTPNVTVTTAAHFIQTIDGVNYDFLSGSNPTASQVVTGLAALINGDTSANCVASGSSTLILTAKTAGSGFAHSESANLVAVTTTANHGAIEDLTAASNANSDWYAIISVDRTPSDVLEVAAYVETQKKMFFTSSSDSAMLTSGTSDIGSQLKALNYSRTSIQYSATPTNFPEAAWCGLVLPYDPGSETWKFKNLQSEVADNLTSNQINNLIAKNVNYYVFDAGVAIMAEGVTAAGQFIDVIRFIDWLQINMQELIFGTLANVKKIPYTDIGVAQIELLVRKQLQEAEDVGGITKDPKYTVTTPKVADINVNDRAARYLPGIKFTAVLAGAVHSLQIQGVVTV